MYNVFRGNGIIIRNINITECVSGVCSCLHNENLPNTSIKAVFSAINLIEITWVVNNQSQLLHDGIHLKNIIIRY